MTKRKYERFIKRLETTFSSGTSRYRGISSDLSEGGMFIRTQNGFVPGTVLDIELYLPGNITCHMVGTVRRTIKTTFLTGKNGMGVEIKETEPCYFEFLRSVGISAGDRPGISSLREAGPRATSEPVILTCQSCGIKNRVMRDRMSFGPKCGRCGEALRTPDID